MKKIWARIGISLEVTDEEYEGLKRQASDYIPDGGDELERTYHDLDLDAEMSKRFIKDGWQDGDSYIPECIFEFGEERK